MALTSGTKLGPYEVQSPLGAGGMGEVYRARDTRLDRTVAIKVLNSQLVTSPELRARFEREAKIISQMQHPHICVLHDVGSDNGTNFLVMEFLQGESLAERLKRSPLAAPELLKIAIQIADALEKAHRAGVVHRDLKPGNVMLTKTGAKLLDFGLAKPLAAGVTPKADSGASGSVFAAALTQTSPVPSPGSPLSSAGAVIGTVQYMSPEQIQGQEADARSDIFAFGVMLFEMTTGRRAFEGKTQATIVGQILAVDPPPITALRPGTPAGLERVIRNCLTKDPEERYQNVHDLKLELEAVAEAGEQVGTASRPTAGRERIAWIAAAVAVLALLATGAAVLLRRAPAPRVVRSTVLPPKDVRVAATEIALSPDGTRIVFVGETATGRALYVRPLNSTEAQRVAHTEGASYPFWSPDGQWLAFFADGRLKKVDLATGGAVNVADAGAGRGGSWSEDGTIMFAPGATGLLMSVSATGGPVSAATTENEGGISERWPHFLPGGRYVLYWTAYRRNTGAVSADPSDKRTGEYVLDLKTRQSRLIAQTDSGAVYAAGYLLYIWQNNLMAQPFDAGSAKLTGAPLLVTQKVAYDSDRWIGGFSASGDGTLALVSGGQLLPSQLAWVDRSGKQVGKLGEPGIYFWPALAPDDKHVAVGMDVGRQTSIWIFDVERGGRTRFTFDEAASGSYPVWSPDGKQIAFSTDTPSPAMFLKSASGIGTPEKVVDNPTLAAAQCWMPDGKGVLWYGGKTATALALFVYSIAEKKSVALNLSDRVESGKISPDGHWLAYGSRESGASEIYVAPYPELNAKWQVSTAGGTWPAWSRDAKELFYIGADGKLMAAEITTAGGFRASVPEPLFTIRMTNFPGYQYDVARDGRFLINTLIDQGSAEPITLVTNWTAELKK